MYALADGPSGCASNPCAYSVQSISCPSYTPASLGSLSVLEADILYFALFPGRGDGCCNDALLRGMPNRLAELVPGASRWREAVHVADAADLGDGRQFRINANPLKQHVVCYVAEGKANPQ